MSDQIDDFSGSAAKLYNSIDKVVIRRGLLKDDPVDWEMHIMGQTLTIPAEKLEMSGYFRAQFIRTFNYPAPKVKTDEWEVIVALLAREKSEVITEVEESDNVYFARVIFDLIKKIPITEDDEESALLGRCLFKRGDKCYLIGEKIEELIKERGFKITANRLSPAMFQLGMKTESTDRIRLNGSRTRVWAFWADKINEN